MCTIVPLNKSRINLLRELNSLRNDFNFENKRSSYKLIGNAVPVHMGRWVGNVALKYFNSQTA